MTFKPVDTAIVMVVGPLIDDTDFKTVEEAIAYDAAGMDVSLIVEKTDGTTAVTAITLTTVGVNDWVHVDGGKYSVEITAAQNTEKGIGFVQGICTGVLIFESPRYDIVPSNVYDSFVKGTDVLQADVTQLSGDTAAANNLEATYDGTGYVNDLAPPTQAQIERLLDVMEVRYDLSINDLSATTTKFITTLTETDSKFWERAAILFTSGTNDGQMRRIKAYNGITKEITVQTPLSVAPSNGDTFVIPTVRAFITPDIEDIADAMLDELLSEHTIAGSFGATVSNLNDISVADIIAGIADGTYDFQEMVRIMFAALSGKSSGGGTLSLAFRDAADSKDRISETVDVNGNRVIVTRDGT